MKVLTEAYTPLADDDTMTTATQKPLRSPFADDSEAFYVGDQNVAHGSTGAGNDQVRFDMIFQVLAPEIKIITLIRDLQLSREDEIKYLKTQGINLPWEKAKYSINQGLWGTSVGGAETLTSNSPLPEAAYPSQLKTETPKFLTLSFKKGELIKLNKKLGSPVLLKP